MGIFDRLRKIFRKESKSGLYSGIINPNPSYIKPKARMKPKTHLDFPEIKSPSFKNLLELPPNISYVDVTTETSRNYANDGFRTLLQFRREIEDELQRIQYIYTHDEYKHLFNVYPKYKDHDYELQLQTNLSSLNRLHSHLASIGYYIESALHFFPFMQELEAVGDCIRQIKNLKREELLERQPPESYYTIINKICTISLLILKDFSDRGFKLQKVYDAKLPVTFDDTIYYNTFLSIHYLETLTAKMDNQQDQYFDSSLLLQVKEKLDTLTSSYDFFEVLMEIYEDRYDNMEAGDIRKRDFTTIRSFELESER